MRPLHNKLRTRSGKGYNSPTSYLRAADSCAFSRPDERNVCTVLRRNPVPGAHAIAARRPFLRRSTAHSIAVALGLPAWPGREGRLDRAGVLLTDPVTEPLSTGSGARDGFRCAPGRIRGGTMSTQPPEA